MWFLNQYDWVGAWTGLIWFRTVTNEGLLRTRQWTFGLHDIRRISGLAENLFKNKIPTYDSQWTKYNTRWSIEELWFNRQKERRICVSSVNCPEWKWIRISFHCVQGHLSTELKTTGNVNMITYFNLLPKERISGVKLSLPLYMPLWHPQELLYLLNPTIRKPIIELYWTNFNRTELSGTYLFFDSCFYKNQVLRYQFEVLEIEFSLSISSGSPFCRIICDSHDITHRPTCCVYFTSSFFYSVKKFVNCTMYIFCTFT